jgi:hypothetical protein
MANTSPKRNRAQTTTLGLTPYIKALSLATGLMLVWFGLCAI